MKVLLEKKGPIAYVTINRPERLNARDFETYEMLAQTWREFRYDAALRVAILTCAGERALPMSQLMGKCDEIASC